MKLEDVIAAHNKTEPRASRVYLHPSDLNDVASLFWTMGPYGVDRNRNLLIYQHTGGLDWYVDVDQKPGTMRFELDVPVAKPEAQA